MRTAITAVEPFDAIKLLLLTLLLCGCTPQPSNDTAQVLARVGNTEITQLQYEYTLERMGVSEPSPEVRQEVIQKLIDRELAVQQAERLQLDRQPEWVLAQGEARRDLLAKAYVDQLITQIQKPDENQLLRFYRQHPELFSHRQIYHLQEAAIPASLPQLAELRQRLGGGQNLDQTLAWLQSLGVTIKQQRAIRAAEQLPLEVLPRLQQAKPGESLFFRSPRGLLLYQISSIEAAPMVWPQARQLIADYLGKQTGKLMLENELQQLRNQSAISLSGTNLPVQGVVDAGVKP